MFVKCGVLKTNEEGQWMTDEKKDYLITVPLRMVKDPSNNGRTFILKNMARNSYVLSTHIAIIMKPGPWLKAHLHNWVFDLQYSGRTVQISKLLFWKKLNRPDVFLNLYRKVLVELNMSTQGGLIYRRLSVPFNEVAFCHQKCQIELHGEIIKLSAGKFGH